MDRNRLRRQMREAYRLNKEMLSHSDTRYYIAFNYIDKTMQDYSVISKAMKKALKKLSQVTDEKMD